MPKPSPDLDDLARALHLSIGRIARVLRRSHQAGELTLSEASLLARIESEGPTTPGSLAEAENVRPQAIAATLSALEAMGYVHREADPSDGRRSIVTLSSAGRALRKARRNESTDRLAAAIAETLDPADVDQLRVAVSLLTRLGDVL